MLQEASNHRALFQELARDESSNLAMVPWVPSHSQATSTASATATEMMYAEDSEGTSMEVEQDMCDQPATAGAAQGEALHQWPQHCMGQQPLPLTPRTGHWKVEQQKQVMVQIFQRQRRSRMSGEQTIQLKMEVLIPYLAT